MRNQNEFIQFILNRLETVGIPYMVSGSALSKLEWAKDRNSEIQKQDILGILLSQWNTLDFNYLKTWAKEIGVGALLEHCMQEAKIRAAKP